MQSQGVPGVLSMESRAIPGSEGNTSRCSPRCSLGVPACPDALPCGRLEHLEHRAASQVFRLGVPSQSPAHAHSWGDENTWNTWNTSREGRRP